MRQAGILAAAGLHALEHHVERLADDHRRAADIGTLLGVEPETNIVPLEVPDAVALASAAREQGVLVSVVGPRKVRLVTHLGISDDDARRAGEVVARLTA
jgi:threonine aldolase